MIESTLQIVIECDRCDTQVEIESVLGLVRQPLVDVHELRAWQKTKAGGWDVVTIDGEEIHFCPECLKQKADDKEAA